MTTKGQAGHISYTEAMRLMDLTGLIGEMRTALAAGRRHAMSIPPRAVMFSADEQDAFVSMPAYSDEEKLFITKVGAIITPSGPSANTTVGALVVVYCGKTGALIGTIDGAAVTNIKCAAISGLVTSHCTPAQPHVLAVIGSGVQARQQVLAVSAVRDIAELRLYSRSPANVARFAEEIAVSGRLACRPVICSSIGEAIDGASIVGTTTTAFTPIDTFGNLKTDVHVNCMGGHTCDTREIPAPVLEASTLIVEDRPTAIAEAGVIHHAALEVEDILENPGLAGMATVFSSTGHAFYDFYAAKHLLERAGLLAARRPAAGVQRQESLP